MCVCVCVPEQNDTYGAAGFNALDVSLKNKGLSIQSQGTYERNTLNVAAARISMQAQIRPEVSTHNTNKESNEANVHAQKRGREREKEAIKTHDVAPDPLWSPLCYPLLYLQHRCA